MSLRQSFPQILQKAKHMGQKSDSKGGGYISDSAAQNNSDSKTRGGNGRQNEPLIIPAVKDHKQTFILLHGRGDSAVDFGGGLLDSEMPTYKDFQTAFPHAKFIFPQAPLRKCIRQPGWVLNQWFDNWGYDTTSAEKEEIKLEGLKETTVMLHSLIQQEAELVGGAGNVVIGGLSQGCAASMIALLTWTGQPLGGYVGMCGHLPYRLQILQNAVGSNDDDLITTTTATTTNPEVINAAAGVRWLRRKLDLPKIESEEDVFRSTPAFTAHGDEDKTVPTQYGRNAAKCLKDLGAMSVYHEYEGLVHWYNMPMLEDFIRYLKRKTGWNEDEQAE